LKNLVIVIPIALSVVGTALLAAFGSRSLAIVARLFSDTSTLYDGGNSQFIWASFGVLLFLICELFFLFAIRVSGTIFTAIGGRIAQIFGFAIALSALQTGMSELRRVAPPFGFVLPEEIATDYYFNATMLTIGLCVVAAGQLMIAIGRYRHPGTSNHGMYRNRSAIANILNRLTLIALSLALLIVLGLFVFTTIFEFELLGKLKQSKQLELPWIANDLQGMMIYPFIAYLLAIFYCLADGIRFGIAALLRTDPENA